VSDDPGTDPAGGVPEPPPSAPASRESGPARLRRRVGRHLRWAREQGLGRLIEEDQLNPLERLPLASAKRRWRRAHRVAPNAVPVFVVGVQRSGTNMLVRGLERSPEFEVRNENDGEAFDRFQLRPDPVIRALVERSGHRYVLFKPLIDSHRVHELLDRLGAPSPGRAIWAYREVDGRVRSSVAKFGDSNLQALRRVAAGDTSIWQAGGLSAQRLELLRSFDLSGMSAESGAALFWWLRNQLYFDLGLDGRADVALAWYEATVADPEAAIARVCEFLDFPYRPELAAHVDRRATGARAPLALDGRVRELCDALQGRLAAAYRSAS
jgi:hypothetical protein